MLLYTEMVDYEVNVKQNQKITPCIDRLKNNN